MSQYKWRIEVRHKGLNKYRVIQGTDKHVVEQKARAQRAQWDEQWQRKLEVERKRQEREHRTQHIAEQEQVALERTQEAQEELALLDSVLVHTLSVDDAIDWESLIDNSEFPDPPPQKPAPLPPLTPEPQRSDNRYHVALNLLDIVISSRKTKKEQEVENRFQKEHERWLSAKEEYEKQAQAQVGACEAALATWKQEREAYLAAQVESNAAIATKKVDYANKDPEAILDYCDLVLSNSQYPDYFPQSYELEYNPENGILVVDYELPDITNLPTLREVRYIKSRGEFSEKHISQTQLNQTYDLLLYQIALRTIHELFEADVVDALSAVVFNGYVHTIDPATGQQITPCVLTVQASKEEFEQIDLANVDPRACFKSLKGISGTKLRNLTPVAPLMKISREDARFTEGRDLLEGIEEGYNIAIMDWEDFEHLIRELFEKEFSANGGEVKVTRTSRDGGVDAVAFDPDPIRGGKIVIQAKRYTNTVGVSFVRDLYGTVLNEGATKGILVTTSSYGADAHEFAKNKPLVLIDGNQLLYLLEKHGYQARIDIHEARKLLSES